MILNHFAKHWELWIAGYLALNASAQFQGGHSWLSGLFTGMVAAFAVMHSSRSYDRTQLELNETGYHVVNGKVYALAHNEISLEVNERITK